MKHSFYLPKIETRSTNLNGVPTYIIKGYATTPNNVYPYKVNSNRTFREYFSNNAIDRIKEKIKSQKVFVDIEHNLATKESTKKIIDGLRKKSGNNFDEEISYIDQRFKYSDVPMFKVTDIKIDDHGLFVDIRGNPFYREIDEEHAKYFDSIWGSLENGFINGMSLNFKPTETLQVNDNLTQIDDIEIYGISLTGSPSNDMASITEVAMRSLEITDRGEPKCQKNRLNRKKLML